MVLKLIAASSRRWQELGASPLSLLPGEGYSLGSEMGQQALCMLPASHSRHLPAVEGTLPVPMAGQRCSFPARCSRSLGVHRPGTGCMGQYDNEPRSLPQWLRRGLPIRQGR